MQRWQPSNTTVYYQNSNHNYTLWLISRHTIVYSTKTSQQKPKRVAVTDNINKEERCLMAAYWYISKFILRNSIFHSMILRYFSTLYCDLVQQVSPKHHYPHTCCINPDHQNPKLLLPWKPKTYKVLLAFLLFVFHNLHFVSFRFPWQ